MRARLFFLFFILWVFSARAQESEETYRVSDMLLFAENSAFDLVALTPGEREILEKQIRFRLKLAGISQAEIQFLDSYVVRVRLTKKKLPEEALTWLFTRAFAEAREVESKRSRLPNSVYYTPLANRFLEAYEAVPEVPERKKILEKMRKEIALPQDYEPVYFISGESESESAEPTGRFLITTRVPLFTNEDIQKSIAAFQAPDTGTCSIQIELKPKVQRKLQALQKINPRFKAVFLFDGEPMSLLEDTGALVSGTFTVPIFSEHMNCSDINRLLNLPPLSARVLVVKYQ